MKTQARLPLGFILWTSVAFASPIPVSGYGTFFADPVSSDSSFTISFSGSDGVDSITVNAQCGGGGWGSTGVSGRAWHCDGSEWIDGLSFDLAAGNSSFSLGNGSGYAGGFNSSPYESASVSLIGYVHVTSESCFGPRGEAFCTGSFGVGPTGPTPEPGSLELGLLGLGAIALRIAKKRTRTGSSGAI